MPEAPKTFLTAEWRYLAMLTFEVEPSRLQPFVPRGTELDTHDGRTFVSLVGFRFLRTRVLGVRVPFHQDFDEVNLRFYVRRDADGELRRGVTFIREIVPRALISLVARLAYNEPYVALPMRSEVPPTGAAAPFRVRYAWKRSAGWEHMALAASDSPLLPGPLTLSSFITEHHWGYIRQRDGGTLEYRVEHPPWRVWSGTNPEISGDIAELPRGAPASVLLAEGSPVTIFRPVALVP